MKLTIWWKRMRSKQIRYTMNKTKTGPKKINDCGISIVLQRQRHSEMKINNSWRRWLVRKLSRQVTLRREVRWCNWWYLLHCHQAHRKISAQCYHVPNIKFISFLQLVQLWIKSFPSSLPRSEILRHWSILDHHWTGLKYKILQIHHRLHQFLFSVIFWWI